MYKETNVFKEKKIRTVLIFAVVIMLFIGSSALLEFNVINGFSSIPKAMSWMISNLIPDKKALERLPKIVGSLKETILLSISLTFLAAIVAFTMSLLGSRTMGLNNKLGKVIRMVATFFRNVPDVVWAMLFLFSFGQNIMTGFLALFFTTLGLLTRAFIEILDEVSSESIEALKATGATFIQIVFQGIIPTAISGIITWILYMIETNIRSSTLIGILTATGIGHLFDLYYKRLDFGSVGLIVFSIVLVVVTIESISNKIRRVIL